MKTSWDIFNNWGNDFKISNELGWGIFKKLDEKLKSYRLHKKELLKTLKENWDKKLHAFGGDPSTKNWLSFRPLRLTREEDWSDWLIFLIAESQTGFFSKKLLNFYHSDQNTFVNPIKAEREVISGKYRADLIIQWRNNTFIHIEVKVGDPNLEKTYATANEVQTYLGVRKEDWVDCVLILPSQLEQWQSIKSSGREIFSILWSDVAIALRRSLLYSEENISWKVWACSFIGAIEQKILNLHRNIHSFSIDDEITILEDGLQNG